MFKVFSAVSGTVSVALKSAVPVLRSFYPKAVARATEVRGWMNTGKRAEAIFPLIEASELHFMETKDGLVFICLNSFPADTFYEGLEYA